MKHKNVFTKVLKRFAALMVILTLTLSLVPITSGVVSHAEGEQGNNTNLDFDADTDDGPDYVDVRTEIPYESMVKGTGTETDPYTISSADALIGMRMLIEKNENFSTGKFFKLTKDIDFSGVCGKGIGDWTPIGKLEGNPYDEYAFDGTFDGCGHTVKGLYIEKGAYGCGLFGEIEIHGVVSNLKVEGNVTGTTQIGGIAGHSAKDAKIEKCSFKGTVNGSENMVGGIVGYTKGNVVNCKAEG
ncbi:MAG: hypothetical protein K5639_05795, partial [Eubacterium sp.]|nr:hypothetical protein [Eubacterium sp.]